MGTGHLSNSPSQKTEEAFEAITIHYLSVKLARTNNCLIHEQIKVGKVSHEIMTQSLPVVKLTIQAFSSVG